MSGHQWPDIQGYTLNQVGVFVKEAAKAKETNRKNLVYSTWIGFNADKQTIDSILKKPATAKTPETSVKGDWLRLARDLRGIG